jgi:hypothetical protein
MPSFLFGAVIAAIPIQHRFLRLSRTITHRLLFKCFCTSWSRGGFHVLPRSTEATECHQKPSLAAPRGIGSKFLSFVCSLAPITVPFARRNADGQSTNAGTIVDRDGGVANHQQIIADAALWRQEWLHSESASESLAPIVATPIP